MGKAEVKIPRNVGELPRNDIDACRRLYRAHGITADDADVMAMLQDDPAELDAVMVRERWKIRK
jgi:hypothetical protein